MRCETDNKDFFYQDINFKYVAAANAPNKGKKHNKTQTSITPPTFFSFSFYMIGGFESGRAQCSEAHMWTGHSAESIKLRLFLSDTGGWSCQQSRCTIQQFLLRPSQIYAFTHNFHQIAIQTHSTWVPDLIKCILWWIFMAAAQQLNPSQEGGGKKKRNLCYSIDDESRPFHCHWRKEKDHLCVIMTHLHTFLGQRLWCDSQSEQLSV